MAGDEEGGNPSEHAVYFEGIKVSLSQDKNGYILRLAIHPDEVPETLLRDFVGSRYIVAMVRTDDQSKPVENPDVLSGKKAVKMAGMLCANNQFQVWLVGQGYADDLGEDAATVGLRRVCRISSRAELKDNKAAREKFFRLVEQFELDARG